MFNVLRQFRDTYSAQIIAITNGGFLLLIIFIGIIIFIFDSSKKHKNLFYLVTSGMFIGIMISIEIFMRNIFVNKQIITWWITNWTQRWHIHYWILSFLCFIVGLKLAFISAIVFQTIGSFISGAWHIGKLNVYWSFMTVCLSIGPYCFFKLMHKNNNQKNIKFFTLIISYNLLFSFFALLDPIIFYLTNFWQTKEQLQLNLVLRCYLLIFIPINSMFLWTTYNIFDKKVSYLK